MRISEMIQCHDFPCMDILLKFHRIPDIQIVPDTIKVLMISEAPSKNDKENFYSTGNQDFMRTTIQLFRDAGFKISRIGELIEKGIYITTATKCPKKDVSISAKTIQACSFLLEQELKLFNNIKVIVCNGDVAIKALNQISKRTMNVRAVPAGSTYKIRKEKLFYNNLRIFPSYILTGKNILIEKSKRAMITEDLIEAKKYL